MKVSSTDSIHHHHQFFHLPTISSFIFPPFKPDNAPFIQIQEKKSKPTEKHSLIADKQDIGAVDALKWTKPEIDTENIIYWKVSKKYC